MDTMEFENKMYAAYNNYMHSTLPNGEIDFGEFTSWNQCRKFVRIKTKGLHDLDKPASDLVQLLLKEWKVKKPQLLISVTGGAVDFVLPEGIKLAFHRGLIKAATSTNAWVITGGTSAGVMEHVGQAVQEYKEAHEFKKNLVVLGIAAWGCLTGRDDLEMKPTRGIVKYQAYIEDFHRERKENECPLDPNHTHFILVDNDTEHKYGSEIKLRAKLEAKLSEINKAEDGRAGTDVKKTIPVCIVLEGGYGTLKTVRGALKHGTPVVIIQGSGRMADLLADVFNFKETDKEEQLAQRVKEMGKEFNLRPKQLKKCVDMINFCMDDEQRKLIEIFTIKPGEDYSVDKPILNAILKVTKYEETEKLYLMQQWNRCDLASKLINVRSHIQPADYLNIFISALLSNQTELVEQFLQTVIRDQYKGLKDKIDSLYKSEMERSDSKSALVRGLEKQKKNEVHEKLIRLITDLLDFGKDVKLEGHSDFCQIFIWCVLTNKREMAMLFWDQCKEQLAYALIAQKLLARLRSYTKDSDEILRLTESAKFFGNHAMSFLGHMFTSAEEKCREVVVVKTETFALDTSVLKLANRCKNKGFVAHSACQSILENVWRGKIASDASHVMILAALFVPALTYIKPFDIMDDKDQESAKSTNKSQVHSETSQNGETSNTTPSCLCLELYKAPISKFLLTCVGYTLFLFLFSINLTSFFDETFGPLDYILILWVFQFLVEECRQAWERGSLKKYICNVLNILDLISIAAFGLAYIIRFSCTLRDKAECLVWARTIGSISNIVFFIRVLNFLSVSKFMGPKIVMIGKMLKHLLAYMLVLLMFVVSFGVMIQAVLFPGKPVNAELFKDILRMPYFQLYGELFLEDLEGSDCQYGGSREPGCPDQLGRHIVPIVLGVYILITNVLILNLIIAMFSFTVNHIHENTDAVWRMQRYHLVLQFYKRPFIPPPFVIIEYIIRLIIYIKDRKKKPSNAFRQDVTKGKRKTLQSWETLMADEFMRKTKRLKEKDSQ